jgi:hypothetical protein
MWLDLKTELLFLYKSTCSAQQVVAWCRSTCCLGTAKFRPTKLSRFLVKIDKLMRLYGTTCNSKSRVVYYLPRYHVAVRSHRLQCSTGHSQFLFSAVSRRQCIWPQKVGMHGRPHSGLSSVSYLGTHWRKLNEASQPHTRKATDSEIIYASGSYQQKYSFTASGSTFYTLLAKRGRYPL